MRLSAANLAKLHRVLRDLHGPSARWIEEFPLNSLAADPLDLLIGTVLSQATNDRNSSRAFAALRGAFPSWEAVLAAPEGEVARAIASGGLAQQKARAIKGILARLRADYGRLSLDRLKGMPAGEVRRYLVSLPGVGPKTAACVQLFALGQPAFPVDVHIHRLARRLGLAPAKTDPAGVQARLEKVVRPEDCHPLHLLLIHHGRRICRPAKPRCGECPLAEDCPGRAG